MDLRSFLKKLEDSKDLAKVRREVDPKYEIAAILRKLDVEGGPAVLFENVRGYKMSVVGNLAATKKRIAIALNTTEENLTFHYLHALEKTGRVKKVGKAPVKEVVAKEVNIKKLLPVLTHYERDDAPYISAGVVFYRDPETGARGVSIHRLRVVSEDKLGISIETRPLIDYYLNAKRKGEPFPVAISIGHDPGTLLACVAEVPVGFDKLRLIEPLTGKPIDLVECETSNIEVPANAEIILEGEIDPREYVEEGLVGEALGYYTKRDRMPIIKIRAITHRANPLYHAILFDGSDTHNLIGIPVGAAVYKAVRSVVPGIKNVNMVYANSAVISLEKKLESDSRSALLAALSLYSVKQAIAVDHDVNIFDLKDIWWAILTRLQKDGIIPLTKLPGWYIDPTNEEGMVMKVGFDATKPLKEAERYERVRIPGEEKVRTEDYLGG
jgi:2,5-furandicarboxylate decarboxylase 1